MTPSRDILLIWDIDGTLVNMDRAGERTWLVVVKDLYQRDLGERLPINMNGRTDISVVRDVLAYLGVPVTPEEEERMRSTYFAHMAGLLPQLRPFIHPGIREALDAVHAHPNIHQALLTGNFRDGARLKLSCLGLWDYFQFGAYSDDSANRDALGPIVLSRAEESLGIKFPPDDVYVVGDTPHDIACGKAIGAKTIAVATGSCSFDELAALKPTYTFKNLSDTAALLKVLV